MNVYVNLTYYIVNFTEEICFHNIFKLCQNVTFFVLIFT